MKFIFVALLSLAVCGLSGCMAIDHAFCAPHCQSETHNSSSLVSFLYPDGKAPPATDSIPQLSVPLRVGLAFLPSTSYGATSLTAAQENDLLETIRKHFADRKFISDIVIIPDYYLSSQRGFSGLEGVQRLYSTDLIALVSYDQVTHLDDNKLSLGYLTIVGAYVLPGSSHDVTTLVDLAVVDPMTRSLVLRAGGTDSRHGSSTLIDQSKNVRVADADGFSAATTQMIGNFDGALTQFENDVRAGKANVKVSNRNYTAGTGGGGSLDLTCLLVLLLVTLVRVRGSQGSGNTAEQSSATMDGGR